MKRAEDFEGKLLDRVSSYDAVLYIKGAKNFPLCGFSACSISILKQYRISMWCENVLTDCAFFEWLKKRNDWPVLPHIYLFGEFLGGYDILKGLHESGRLTSIINSRRVSYDRPCVA